MTNRAVGTVLNGQHAVVTGGGSGIGAAIVAEFKRAGAAVTIMGRSEVRLQETAKEIGVDYVVADVSNATSVTHAFGAAAEQNGSVDILVNNAGIAEAMPFAKMQAELWRRTIAVNLDGVFHCTSAVVPTMLERGYGRVINVASTAAVKGYAYVGAYCASKHGVLGLTRSLALEFAQRGITVNAICPGYTDTDVVARSIEKIVAATGRSDDEALAELVQANPQGRLVDPDEIAHTALWLADKRSRSITGQAIAVAGGEVM